MFLTKYLSKRLGYTIEIYEKEIEQGKERSLHLFHGEDDQEPDFIIKTLDDKHYKMFWFMNGYKLDDRIFTESQLRREIKKLMEYAHD